MLAGTTWVAPHLAVERGKILQCLVTELFSVAFEHRIEV
jgi:hypothetical protein